MVDLGLLGLTQKSVCFSECGRVAYQIKGYKAYNNMLASNCSALKHTLDPWVGSKCQLFFLF